MPAKIALPERFASTIENPSAFSPRVTPPMTCPSCGSTHFVKALAEEFSNTGYGSAEFRALSTGFQPLSVYVCLCGTPMPVQGLAQECHYNDHPKGRYLRSLHKAIAHRKAQQPQLLARGFVSLAEYEELRDQVAMQQEQIEGLLDAIAALEHAKGDDSDEDI